MWLIKKFMQKIKNFNVKWTLKNKNLQQPPHFIKFKLKKYILKKFQCISLINFSFHDFFLIFNFNTILTFF